MSFEPDAGITPHDYRAPPWETVDRIQNWRNYITAEVRAMWSGFTDEQQAALARQAQGFADREDWD